MAKDQVKNKLAHVHVCMYVRLCVCVSVPVSVVCCLRLKAGSKTEAFIIYTKRNQRYLTECLGDANIEEMSPRDGADFHDHLLAKGLSSSFVRRVFSTVKAVINLRIS